MGTSRGRERLWLTKEWQFDTTDDLVCLLLCFVLMLDERHLIELKSQIIFGFGFELGLCFGDRDNLLVFYFSCFSLKLFV